MADTAQELENEGLASLFGAEADKVAGPHVYEVGYHLLPSLSEQEVTAATKDLINFLKKEGATLVGQQDPQMVDLSYAIERRVAGKFVGVNTAYFGWVAFEVEPRATATIKLFMDTNASVLRHILISTTKDEVKAVMEGKVIMPTAAASTEAIHAPKRATEESAVVSEEALSQAIDSMNNETKSE
jgi:ribosomal protein S6